MSAASKAVFLSYASEDSEAATRLAEGLKSAGIEVWFDRTELRGGDAWDRQIRRQIHDCALFLPVISAHCTARHEGYFRREWKLAVDRTADMAEDVTFLVPVAIDETLESAARVPDSFRDVQWSRMPGGHVSPAFVTRLQHLLSPSLAPDPRESQDVTAISSTIPAVPARRHWRVPAVLVLGVLAVAGLVYFAGGRLRPDVPSATVPGSPSVTAPGSSGALAPDDKSIAVLPFADLSEKHDQEYLADGIAEELLDVLATVPGLRVIGRTSSFQFRNRSADVRTIGTTLGVAHVVEGSVRRSGDHIRVTVQLLRTSDGSHVWSGSFDRTSADVLRMQGEIAREVGRSLEVSVASDLLSGSPFKVRNADALDLYFRGMQALVKYSAESNQEAAEDFQRAIDLDPGFIRAYEGLGSAHIQQAAYGFVAPEAGFELVRNDALALLKIDPRSALAHALLARIHTVYTWDWNTAQQEADAALAIRPHEWGVLFTAAELALALGQLQKSEQLFRASIASDPLNSDSRVELSQVYLRQGRLGEAEAEVRKALVATPSYLGGHGQLALILLEEGRYGEALDAAMQEAPAGGQFGVLAEIQFRMGHQDVAKSWLEREIREHGEDQAWTIACAYGQLGQAGPAFEWLDRAYQRKDPNLVYLKGTPEFRNLVRDARYQAFLRKMNLPE
ncbi:MAG: TIR domain-containing protein [Proteobacteria bacterium]|nr:TIR domain-containing protein [Pseudomonadota bacterium]